MLSVKGVGAKRAGVLADAGIHTVGDLLFYLPRRYLDRSVVARIVQLTSGAEVTILAQVTKIQLTKRPRTRLIVTVEDDSGAVNCVWFGGGKFFAKNFVEGDSIALSGKVGFFNGELQFTHPEYEFVRLSGEQNFLHTSGIVPLYSTSADMKERGLRSRTFRRVMAQALEQFGDCVVETMSPEAKESLGLMDLPTSLRLVHFPTDANGASAARRRLAFEELYQQQLLLARARVARRAARDGVSLSKRDLVERFCAGLQFVLTKTQRHVVEEILEDLSAPYQMCRLLQGDVGSGKTVVALVAVLQAIGSGYQAALMAPTEILATQHYNTVVELLGPLGANAGLLIGKQPAALRAKMLTAIETGAIDIVVGTHALIQEAVSFPKLGLAIVDEQHRFGVVQRENLAEKGNQANLLFMTATPIPRTLALAVYGDTDLSILDELLPGRRPVRTASRTADRREAIFQFVAEQLELGRQAYLVYPSIEDSHKLAVRSATTAFGELSAGALAKYRVALLHGQMKEEEKRDVMQTFVDGTTQVLVSTTVVEVGVDVANATVMVIENAERFGLAQLHQLRGRVGRGGEESYCILIHGELDTPEFESARQRIDLLCQTNDGFEIADRDLAVRGQGELLGTAQAGKSVFAVADLSRDGDILRQARRLAVEVAEKESADAATETLSTTT